MNAYLLKYGVCGIKNLKEYIELSFYKKGIEKNFDPSDYKIKSIYGENGAGKTAIVTSFSILKKLILFPDYLSDPKTQDLLHHIVHKETQMFRLYAEFLIMIHEIPHVFSYEISVEKDENTEMYEITHETLKYKKATYAKAVYRELFEVNNGRFTLLAADENELEIITNRTMNLLKRSSAISRLMDLFADQLADAKAEDLSTAVLLLQYTALQMYAFLNEEDEHYLFYAKKNLEKLRDVSDITNEHIKKTLHQMNEIISFRTNRIPKEAMPAYERKIQSLTSFIRIFKSSLQEIHIEKKDFDAKYYEVSLVFDYQTYRVDYEFESTGIKKMVQVYDAIWAVSKGGIVFVDEFDANINSIYFDKLIEYVRDYSNGQLCFTVHNTSSMDSLKAGKDSINFLTNDNQIVRWTKNGHYSPDVLYRNGMIEKMPFNIYGSDFVSIFEDDYE
jgi:AAA15 family ATPase/GTPase